MHIFNKPIHAYWFETLLFIVVFLVSLQIIPTVMESNRSQTRHEFRWMNKWMRVWMNEWMNEWVNMGLKKLIALKINEISLYNAATDMNRTMAENATTFKKSNCWPMYLDMCSHKVLSLLSLLFFSHALVSTLQFDVWYTVNPAPPGLFPYPRPPGGGGRSDPSCYLENQSSYWTPRGGVRKLSTRHF